MVHIFNSDFTDALPRDGATVSKIYNIIIGRQWRLQCVYDVTCYSVHYWRAAAFCTDCSCFISCSLPLTVSLNDCKHPLQVRVVGLYAQLPRLIKSLIKTNTLPLSQTRAPWAIQMNESLPQVVSGYRGTCIWQRQTEWRRWRPGIQWRQIGQILYCQAEYFYTNTQQTSDAVWDVEPMKIMASCMRQSTIVLLRVGNDQWWSPRGHALDLENVNPRGHPWSWPWSQKASYWPWLCAERSPKLARHASITRRTSAIG